MLVITSLLGGLLVPATGAAALTPAPTKPAVALGIEPRRSGRSTPALAASTSVAAVGGTHDSSLSTPWSLFESGVNVVAGNLSFAQIDLSIPSIGFATALTRTYSSALAATDGPFGYGWSWSLGPRVAASDGGADLLREDGRNDHFVNGTTGNYVAPLGVYDTLTDVSGGGWLLVRHDQARLAFNAAGGLASVTDPNGNALYLSYVDGRLASVRDTAERTWSFDQTAAGHISAAHDPAGRTTAYGYSTAGDLASVVDAAGAMSTFSYVGHRLTGMTDPRSNTTSFAYDAQARVTGVTDALGSATTFAYDPANRHTTVTDPLANAHSYDYDSGNRINRLTDALGQAESWSWDGSNNRIGVSDRNGGVATSEYDARGNPTLVTNPEGGQSRVAYDAQNRPTSKIDALGRTTALVSDSHGNLAQVTDAAGRVTTYAYDQRGQLVASNDGNGHTTSFGYDATGNRTATTNALGFVSRQGFDSAGRLTSETDADGRTTQHSYDPMGRKLATTDGAGGTTRWAYDAAGNRTSTTDQRGNVTQMTYDALNRLTRSVDALGGATAVVFDRNGNRTSVTDPLGHATTFAYDAANRLVRTTDPNGHVSAVVYDGVGNRVRVTDALGRAMNFHYDRLNRLVGVDDAAGGHAAYTYDAAGNRTSTTDPNGNASHASFDALDRAVSETDALTHSSSAAYDAVGNLTSRTDANAVTTRLVYDAADRMVRADYAEGAVTFAYDRAGNRVAVTDTSGTTAYTYDGLGRVTSNTSPSGTVSYTYDAAGNLSVLTNPDGTTVRHTYDALNREIAVTDSAGRTSNVTFDAAGRRTGEDRPNGTQATYAFDSAGQVTAINWTGPGGAAVSSFAYTYDAAGNKTRVVDAGGTSTFTYDALDRLTGTTYPLAGTTTYAYDPAGNRTSMTVNGVVTSYSYNAGNQQVAAGSNAVTWDAAGNMKANGSTTYRHDSQNRLIGVERGSLVEQFSYNGADNRTSQGVNDIVTHYGYDIHGGLPQVVTESSSANGHVYGLGGTVLWDSATDQGLTYYHQDAMGSTAALTRADGTVAGTRSYDAFGAPRGPQVGTGSYWFDGEQYDPNSGLIYLRARYYDPTSGRFLEPDPAAPDLTSPQTLNKYAYANNNPLRFIDPSGQSWSSVLGVVLGSGLSAADDAVSGRPISVGSVVGSLASGAYSAACPLPGVCGAIAAVVGWDVEVLLDVALKVQPPSNSDLFSRIQTGFYGDFAAYGISKTILPHVAQSVPKKWLSKVLESQKALDSYLRVVTDQLVEMVYRPIADFDVSTVIELYSYYSSAHSDAWAGTGSKGTSSQVSVAGNRSSSPKGGKSSWVNPFPGLPAGPYGGSNWSASYVTASGLSIPLGGAYIPLGYVAAAGVSGGNAAGGVDFCNQPGGHGYCVRLGIGGYSNLIDNYHIDRAIVSIVDVGFHVTLWDQQNLSGTPTYMDSSGNVPAGKENTTRSIRVERLGDTSCNQGSDGVVLFRDTDFSTRGGCVFTQTSIPDLRPSTFDEAITSLRFVGSFVGTKQVLLYRHANYQDLCGTFTQNWSDLNACARNAVSVQVLDYVTPPPITVPPGTFYAGNTAPYATRDGAGSDVTVDGSLNGEWQQGSATGFGFSWPHPVTTGHIVVWDRVKSPAVNGIGNLSIGFSDGTMLRQLDMGVQGPRCVDVTFPAKTVTWVNLLPSGYQPGYREVQIWATTGPQSSPDACANPRTADAVPGSFPAPTVIVPLDTGPPGPPIDDLVVSAVASESSDGVSHDAAHPYLVPTSVHYRTMTIKQGAYASVNPWNGSSGGSTRITVEGAVLIDGVLDVSGLGYRGGPPRLGANGGVQGESFFGLGDRTNAPNGGGGGGAFGPNEGGGGGGYATDGLPGRGEPGHPLMPGGVAYGDATLSTVYLGSGGGSSGAQSESWGAAGGAGGGAVDLVATSIRVTGRVSANGQNGPTAIQGDASNYRGGGGGSGGSVRLAASTVDVGSGLVTATGGTGGYGLLDSTNRADGGAGAVGRVRLEYTATYSGTTNPPASAAFVSTAMGSDLIVSTDPAQSSDRQAHDAGNPYLIASGSRFGSVTVQPGAYASVAAWNGLTGGLISLVVTGEVRIQGTLTVAGKGYRGGRSVGSSEGFQGESTTGPGVRSRQANGGGGGGGGGDSGGAGGGYGSVGQIGWDIGKPGPLGGGVYGDPTVGTVPLGSGGGSAGAGSQVVGPPAGGGGGAIDIQAAAIRVTGVVSADGQAGLSQEQWGVSRGSGGGSGGSVRLRAPIVDFSTGSITALGGAGGYGVFNDGRSMAGGDGGVGRIRLEYGPTVAGSTSPAASQVVFFGPLDHVGLSPAAATAVAGGTGQAYSVTGFDAAGNSLGDLTATSSFSIGPDGSCAGTTCRATIGGPHTVTATNAGKQSTATLTISAGALDRLVLTPASVTLQAGETQT